MKYDPKKFKKMHAERMKGVTYVNKQDNNIPVRRNKKANSYGWSGLADAVIMLAVKDYRRAVKGRPSVTQAWVANLLKYENTLTEVTEYFMGTEFLFHCELCGYNPQAILRHYGVPVTIWQGREATEPNIVYMERE